MYYDLPITNAIMVRLFTPRLCKLGSNQVWLFNTFNNSFFKCILSLNQTNQSGYYDFFFKYQFSFLVKVKTIMPLLFDVSHEF